MEQAANMEHKGLEHALNTCLRDQQPHESIIFTHTVHTSLRYTTLESGEGCGALRGWRDCKVPVSALMVCTVPC